MKKVNRVKKNYEFQKIISTGKSVSSRCFVVFYLKRKEETYDRIGISSSKKLGDAVERNKIRRQVRMMIDEIFNFNSGFDYIIIVKQPYLKRTYEDNKKDLSRLYYSVYNKQGQTYKGE